MGNNLFNILFSTVKSRLASIVSKLRLWLSWNYIRSRAIGVIRDFFFKLLDVKPKNKDDYYTIFGWMISKRLAYAVIILIGVLSVWYLTATSQIFDKLTTNGGLRTYSYDSMLLRFAKNKVRIKAKSGYLAYEGDVSKGYCTGEGNLYSPAGVQLYAGTFEKNRYEGQGNQYYESGALHYTGTFHENLYEGEGKLYREDGTQEYEGGFSKGMKEGAGKLYNLGNNMVYEGSFSSDGIVYNELLGKTPEEIRSMYYGSQVLYEESPDMGSDAVVYMKDINALYLAKSDGSAADDSMKASAVMVLSDSFRSGVDEATDIDGLKQILGDPIYEGNSSVIVPEAVAINILNDEKRTLNGKVKMETTAVYSDDVVIESLDDSYTVYVYTFKRGDLVYSFVSNKRDGSFAFYEVMEGEGTGNAS